MAMLSAVYMKIFLPDSIIDDNLSTPIISEGKLDGIVNPDESDKKMQMFKAMPSIEDMLALLKSRYLKFQHLLPSRVLVGIKPYTSCLFVGSSFNVYLMFLTEWKQCPA